MFFSVLIFSSEEPLSPTSAVNPPIRHGFLNFNAISSDKKKPDGIMHNSISSSVHKLFGSQSN